MLNDDFSSAMSKRFADVDGYRRRETEMGGEDVTNSTGDELKLHHRFFSFNYLQIYAKDDC